MIRTNDIKQLLRITSVVIAGAAYLLLWIEAHFIRTDYAFQRNKSKFIVILATIFDIFNCFVVIILMIALFVWAWL